MTKHRASAGAGVVLLVLLVLLVLVAAAALAVAAAGDGPPGTLISNTLVGGITATEPAGPQPPATPPGTPGDDDDEEEVIEAEDEPLAPPDFTDIDDHWARQDILRLAGLGIVQGVGDGRFEPDRPVTRAEATAILARTFDLEPVGTDAFSDVGPDAWFYAEVGAGAAAGVVEGYPDHTFRPGNPITRAETAAMLIRAMANLGGVIIEVIDGMSEPLEDFADVGAFPAWAEPYLARAVAAGLLGGYPDQTLRPDNPVTRAELAAMTARMLDRLEP